MSSNFFKSFYSLILFIIIFSIIITIVFVPALSNEFNTSSFTYERPNISSMYSSTDSITMNLNSDFLWPTPRLYYNYFSFWKKVFPNIWCINLS